MKALMVFVSASSQKEADRIARVLVEEKLAACVTVLPKIDSQFRWEGKIQSAREVLLIIKTMSSRFKALEKRIRTLHSYSVPEILALPVVAGNSAYLQWLKKSV